MLFFISVLFMANPAQGHKVVDGVSLPAAAHAPCPDMVDVHGLAPADLTGDECLLALRVTEMVEVYFNVFFHLYC
jgi:hypothetical protein